MMTSHHDETAGHAPLLSLGDGFMFPENAEEICVNQSQLPLRWEIWKPRHRLDLSKLSTFTHLKRIMLLGNAFHDESITFSSNCLECLYVGTAPKFQRLNGLNGLPNLKVLELEAVHNIRSLACDDTHSGVVQLVIYKAHSLCSLDGLQSFPNLQFLTVHHTALGNTASDDFFEKLFHENPNLLMVNIGRQIKFRDGKCAHIRELCRENNVLVGCFKRFAFWFLTFRGLSEILVDVAYPMIDLLL
jgi:hypothetical protein